MVSDCSLLQEALVKARSVVDSFYNYLDGHPPHFGMFTSYPVHVVVQNRDTHSQGIKGDDALDTVGLCRPQCVGRRGWRVVLDILHNTSVHVWCHELLKALFHWHSL